MSCECCDVRFIKDYVKKNLGANEVDQIFLRPIQIVYNFSGAINTFTNPGSLFSKNSSGSQKTGINGNRVYFGGISYDIELQAGQSADSISFYLEGVQQYKTVDSTINTVTVTSPVGYTIDEAGDVGYTPGDGVQKVVIINPLTTTPGGVLSKQPSSSIAAAYVSSVLYHSKVDNLIFDNATYNAQTGVIRNCVFFGYQVTFNS